MIDYQPKSFFSVIFRLNGSVLPTLAPRIILITGVGGLAAWLHDSRGIKIPAIAHTLLGVALGLLLVFRTNASFDRFWEGRKLLGAFVNRSRDLVRQSASYIEGDDAEAVRSRSEMRRFVGMFYCLLRQYLRAERDLKELGVPLTDAEREKLEGAAVRPNLAALWASNELLRCVRAGRLSEYRLMIMDQNITALVDFWGGAERIMRTPIPFAYAQHIKTFLTLFCVSAPFAMVESMKWSTPIASAILAFGMFGIDEIGVEIEDPFGYDPNDLPLDAIGKRIDEDTRMIVAQRDAKPAVSEDQAA